MGYISTKRGECVKNKFQTTRKNTKKIAWIEVVTCNFHIKCVHLKNATMKELIQAEELRKMQIEDKKWMLRELYSVGIYEVHICSGKN